MIPFLEALKAGTPFLMDGGMATLLQKRGLPPHTPSDPWNLTHPEEVKKVHREYVGAGSRFLLTNTFGASKNRLAALGLENSLEAINAAGVALCREAANGRAYVGGSVGPIGNTQYPFDSLSFYEAAEIYQEQIFHLLKAGVDAIVLETQFSAKEIKTATVVADDLCQKKIPILLSMTVNQNGLLLSGEDPAELLPYLEETHVSVVGFNCAEPRFIERAIRKCAPQTPLSIAAKPNAGLPSADGQYAIQPEEFADEMKKAVQLGARLVGGCCGTTPAHIKALSRILAG